MIRTQSTSIRMLLILLMVSGLFSFSESPSNRINDINDGPYFFKVEDKIIGMWIEDGVLIQSVITSTNFPEIRAKFDFKFDINALKEDYSAKHNYTQTYEDADSIIALSDIHGQYDLYIELLKANKVIDNDLNWSYGSGHLVIVGDVFDRGEKVNEVLWHLFGLERQAEEAGGKVHLLLGNHEVMVLNNDLRYIHEKYKTTEELINTTYDQLYSDNTVLGSWLRSKPVAITINDIIFTHGGLSPTLVNRKISIEQVNRTFATRIIGKERADILNDELLELLYRSDGPIWYRGYFLDENFTEQSIDSVLNFYNAEHVIVGHCSYDSVAVRFNQKIFGVDTSIKNGQSGELLMLKPDGFYKGTLTGEVKKL